MSRDGFSLIEMLAVLTLMSLILATVGLRWNGAYQAARFQADVERLIDFDFKARRHAIRHHQNGSIQIDLKNNLIEASRWVNGVEKFASYQPMDGAVLEQVMTSTGVVKREKVSLPLLADGSTPTYAALIRQGARQTWLFFAGRTGQPIRESETADVKALFTDLWQQGADAD